MPHFFFSISQLKELQPEKSSCLFIATHLAKFRNGMNGTFLHQHSAFYTGSKDPSGNITGAGNSQTGEEEQ